MSSTTFSYAQAAKGQTIPQPSPQLTSSSAPPSTSSQAKDDVPTGNTSVTAPSVASNDPETRDVGKSSNSEIEVALSRQDSELASIGGSAPSTVSAGDPNAKSSRESDQTTVDLPQHTEDKASRSVSRTSRSNDGADGRKGRKGKKGRSAEKDTPAENQPEEKEKEVVILSEAPPPAVNIWEKRIEDRAKLAPVPSAPSAALKVTTTGNDLKKASSPENGDAQNGTPNGVNGDKSQRKGSDLPRSTDQGQRRGPRGTRADDKDEKSSGALPSVEDTSAWPDPKSAASADVPGPKPQAKADRVVEREGQDETAPTQKKQGWQKMDFQHSVVFETPLPGPRGSKPRGGARGGREPGSSRGNHSSAANATSPSVPNTVSDRATSVNGNVGSKGSIPRPREGPMPTRSASQNAPATSSKRGSVDGAVSKEHRKLSVSVSTEQTRESGHDATASSAKRATFFREGHTDIRLTNGEHGLGSTRSLPQERSSNLHAKAPEYTKDGPNSTIVNQQYGAREGRPERVRGGGYRGRGGHSGAGAHLQQSGYAQNGQYAIPSFQSRQNSAGHSPPHNGQFPGSFAPQPRARGGRWQSASQGRNGSNGAAYAQRLPPPVNDMAAQQYLPYPPVNQLFFDPVFPLIRSQVEYYLSIGNLCKDRYLRQHLDSNGYVKLSVIAGFKRMRELTQDLEALRYACLLSEDLELGVGEDGIDRLRTTNPSGAQFVLAPAERIPELQNDIVVNVTPYQKPISAGYATMYPDPTVQHPYTVASPVGMYPAFPEQQAFQQGYMNGFPYEPAVNGGGVNGHHYGAETQLSAVVPEFQPSMSPLTLEGMTKMPDSQVEKLIIVSAPGSSIAGVAGYIPNGLNHRGLNGVRSREGETSDVNGEAANSEPQQPEPEIIWLDEPPSTADIEHMDRRSYMEVKEAALTKRHNAKPSETAAEMRTLYRFWSQMLLVDFNAKVYDEFRTYALGDASCNVPSRAGLRYLLEFYNNLLNTEATQKPWPANRSAPEIFQLHFQEAVEVDRKLGAAIDHTV
ncbi:hypothetical protein B0H66DRAFT_57731 [Apodospora peruviana]|uniref:HTH La-type RNA-binding domain-containing protein n=1 Tax=Apodospora peruviana TaxID=516989 RepID=A0AAE0MGP5_9PEZI|nr:hypothetical protein B0H66DRAFT_57731 [Apodospora peruviana]